MFHPQRIWVHRDGLPLYTHHSSRISGTPELCVQQIAGNLSSCLWTTANIPQCWQRHSVFTKLTIADISKLMTEWELNALCSLSALRCWTAMLFLWFSYFIVYDRIQKLSTVILLRQFPIGSNRIFNFCELYNIHLSLRINFWIQYIIDTFSIVSLKDIMSSNSHKILH